MHAGERMVDVEFRVVSDQRDGLLLALGQTIIANHFTLLRQRMARSEEGVVLTMSVRGPESGLLMLEERLGTHPMVLSFETTRSDGLPAPTPAPAAPAPAAPATFAPAAPRPPSPAPATVPRAPAAVPSAAPDSRRVEALLPQLARDYPRILIHVLALERELPPDQRESTLRYVGQRVGTWVYKRDFALGGRLPLADAARRIALPAVRQLVQADMQGDILKVGNSPFCGRGEHGACCHFLRGMLGGLLAGTQGDADVHVIESQCRNTGAEACHFEFCI